ncbi:MAG: hypothetical protein ACE5LU_17685 [Anaerolineae bacterium]
MHRRTIKAVSFAFWLSLITLGTTVAQSGSPLVGIPHMSNEPDGPETQKFRAGADTVYLVFDYETDGPVEIIAEIRSEEQQGAVIFISRETYDGTGTANIEIKGPGSSAFPDGVYDTIIRFGEKRYVTAGWEWVVGDVELPSEDTSGGQAPISPLQERESGSQPDLGARSAFNPDQGVQSSSPIQTTRGPGLPPFILVGVGIVVLFLLAVIAWAVRGFMTAA